MAVTVTKQFNEDFDTWSANALKWGDFTQEDMAEFKEMLRKDMHPGPDLLREGLEAINAAGVTVPAMIDNYEDRIKCWTDYFAHCAKAIRQGWKVAT